MGNRPDGGCGGKRSSQPASKFCDRQSTGHDKVGERSDRTHEVGNFGVPCARAQNLRGLASIVVGRGQMVGQIQ